jgi:hypothetical protein
MKSSCRPCGRRPAITRDDAFRAGGYEPAVASRFLPRLEEKIAGGRRVERDSH